MSKKHKSNLNKKKKRTLKKILQSSPRSKLTLNPQCLFQRKNHDQQICLNAAGYFTPCCWFDAEDALKEDDRIAGFFDPALNIENYNDPKDIIEGEYWQSFFKSLVNNPNDAPKRCWRNCGGTLITDKKISGDQSAGIRIAI